MHSCTRSIACSCCNHSNQHIYCCYLHRFTLQSLARAYVIISAESVRELSVSRQILPNGLEPCSPRLQSLGLFPPSQPLPVLHQAFNPSPTQKYTRLLARERWLMRAVDAMDNGYFVRTPHPRSHPHRFGSGVEKKGGLWGWRSILWHFFHWYFNGGEMDVIAFWGGPWILWTYYIWYTLFFRFFPRCLHPLPFPPVVSRDSYSG